MAILGTQSAVVLCLLVTLTFGMPNYMFPEDWSSEEYLEYLMREKQQRIMRPVDNLLFDTDDQAIGMISGIDVNSSGILHIFQRGDRVWDMNTFSDGNILADELKDPIEEAAILALDPVTGRKIGGLGEGLFNMPHGLKFDRSDNLWLTDVGRHQVFRIPKGSPTPDLILGTAFVPGSGNDQFCKPTDVAVAKSGDFFVADGYCNRRILKFDKAGKYITKIGTKDSTHETSNGPDPYTFNTPHSLTLIEDLDLVCVADRENMRALCYNAGIHSDRPVGAFNRTLIPEREIGKVYSIYYNEADNEVIAAGEINRFYPARAYTYSVGGQEQVDWAFITPEVARRGPSLIHALCASPDGRDYFLADVIQKKVYKYSKLEFSPLAQ